MYESLKKINYNEKIDTISQSLIAATKISIANNSLCIIVSLIYYDLVKKLENESELTKYDKLALIIFSNFCSDFARTIGFHNQGQYNIIININKKASKKIYSHYSLKALNGALYSFFLDKFGSTEFDLLPYIITKKISLKIDQQEKSFFIYPIINESNIAEYYYLISNTSLKKDTYISIEIDKPILDLKECGNNTTKIIEENNICHHLINGKKILSKEDMEKYQFMFGMGIKLKIENEKVFEDVMFSSNYKIPKLSRHYKLEKIETESSSEDLIFDANIFSQMKTFSDLEQVTKQYPTEKTYCKEKPYYYRSFKMNQNIMDLEISIDNKTVEIKDLNLFE